MSSFMRVFGVVSSAAILGTALFSGTVNTGEHVTRTVVAGDGDDSLGWDFVAGGASVSLDVPDSLGWD